MQPDTTAQPPPAAIELRVNDGVATLLLNRPQVRNAIDDAMRAELIALLDRIGRDDAIRALVLTGKGKGFCAGGDITGMQRADERAARRGRLQRLAPPAAHAPRHHGAAHPAQADHRRGQRRRPRASAATWRWPATSSSPRRRAIFAMSYIHRGLIPDGGGMYFLPRRVGLARAKELIFTGRKVTRRRRSRSAWSTASPGPTRCWPRPRPGRASSAGLADGAGAHQDDPEPELRAAGGAGLRAGQPGAGHLLHDAPSTRSRSRPSWRSPARGRR